MSKLFKLKEWLTVSEAVKHLSVLFGEEVAESDLLRLGLDGYLDLSVVLFEPILGHEMLAVEREEIAVNVEEYGDVELAPTLPLEHGFQSGGLGDEVPIAASGNYFFNDFGLYLTGRTCLIDGVWDLYMFGSEKREIENMYFSKLVADQKNRINCDGAFLTKGDGRIYCVNRGEDYLLFSKNLLVVRTAALMDFEGRLREENKRSEGGSPITGRVSDNNGDTSYISPRLAAVLQGAREWWSSADQGDRTTHPNSAEVEAWFRKHHEFSQALASSAATIIRPEWASLGRKPEN